MRPTPPMPHQAVVLVHGLYLGPWTLRLLARRLRGAGLRAHCFGYPSVSASPGEVAERLAAYLGALAGDTVHLVAHSLGGLVLHHLFHRHRPQRPGRVVTLGTPHLGSALAVGLRERGLGRVLGRSVEQGLLGDVPPWDATRELGVIAGSLGVGLGRLFGRLAGPNDGTVAVAETRLPAARAHRVLPVSHTGLLVSGRVAGEVARFLTAGEFLPQDRGTWGTDRPIG
jgi:pimeloyl-ACP methyl ester carboxylesterase